jgi:Alginate lyase
LFALLTIFERLAAWTTCPYVARDGQVNPDVRLLNGPEAINSVSQSIIYNAIAYALQKTSSYSAAATSFIDTFFLNPSTKMNPNMNFGQMVRGPGQAGQEGTFTGVLDLRGIVKIINGIMILKAADSPDWTAARDQELAAWMAQYADWLENSLLGKRSASRPKYEFEAHSLAKRGTDRC